MGSRTMTAAPRTREEAVHETRHAPMYKVLLHNDDVTPFEFVEQEVCVGIFRLAHTSARRVTAEVHYTGIGLVGVYPFEQAEFKCDQVISLARGRGYPLHITFEPE